MLATQLIKQKVVSLVEFKILLNPRLAMLKELLDTCEIKNCSMCKEIKEITGIITKI